ncbi:SDR family NAD(P)-dependent oxidoreductase [Amycolatopsis jejuensis]|uniref:SDR family NAD(P)-dependent oxidoreductase n=1 Tax=Amycolatopsis jejuensis TaxID=330084 RepID=UPI000525AFCC|nr:SDR family oxidoreductase [Amycolatopsis jejuensis]
MTGRGRLPGRKILVVGGGQTVHDAATDPVGNGRAMAIVCAREGADVAVADHHLDRAEATVALLEAEPGSGFALRADTREPEEIAAMVETANRRLGGLDGIIYNVGIGIAGLDLAGADPDAWDDVFRVNVRGAMLSVRAAVPHLPPGGSIVLISSIAGLRSGSRLVAYEASKAALAGLLRHAARELGDRDIRVNMVAPGLIDTPNGRRAAAGRPERSTAGLPLRRMGTAWDIAYAALFFLSDESSYITAQTLAVDGGKTGI